MKDAELLILNPVLNQETLSPLNHFILTGPLILLQ